VPAKRPAWILAAAVVLLIRTPFAARSKESAAEQAKFFETQVQPILQAQCLSCHGGEKKIKGGLRLTSRENLLKGGKSGPVVSLTKPAESLLLQAINYQDLKMPPKGKLAQGQIDVLTRWIEMGAPWSAATATIATSRQGPPPVDEHARSFWSFKPPMRPALPQVKDKAWVRNPVDAFVLAKLEEHGYRPAPPADKTTLLRRVYYAVTGLPPTPQEVDAFLADTAADTYENVVDRLLASRHYGEHWGRHWLDLVRFAETNSFERDGPKPDAWKYRDYVIRSFNQDKPYDQFIREQLAGDELEPVTRDGIIATGYYRLGIWDDEPANPELSYYEQLDDILSTTGQTFLGLTVGCARCHDHKIDPFPQKDYYRLVAFFHGINSYGNGPAAQRPLGTGRATEEYNARTADYERQLAELDRQIAAVEHKVARKLAAGEKDDFKHEENRAAILSRHVGGLISKADLDRYLTLRSKREELNQHKPAALEMALAVIEQGSRARETFVLARGMPAARGDRVEPAFPSVLTNARPALPEMPARAPSCGRRRVLAEWIADARNPLTARVMANRLFQFNFGRGIVRSSSNFGYQGTPPTHPELLDWLASELVVGGWRLKPLQRLLLTSNAFRMSGNGNPEGMKADPENDLLARFDARRLTAEEIRDSILAVSGNLNQAKTGGPSVYPEIPGEVLAGQSMPGNGWGKSTPEEAAARSVFVYVKRSLAVPLLGALDTPDPDAPCAVRFSTTQPTQALVMLNSRFMNEQAKVFAESLLKEAGPTPAATVKLALRRVTQRTPSAGEIDRGVKLIGEIQAEQKLTRAEALQRFCLLALNLNEFVYID
jgi:hypothetical protein